MKWFWKKDDDFNSVKIIIFYFISGENEMSFYIQSVHSGKYLDISGGSKESGAQVIIHDFTGVKNQQWSYKKSRIVNKLNG
jgi:rRNA maturation protein Rpf1